MQNAVIVVTGAAGSIGSATARLLLSAGARVALADRRADELHKIHDACRATHGERVASIVMDQCDREAVERALDEAVSKLGPIAGLFANAGYGQFSPFLSTSQKNWNRHVEVNLTGTFNVCQAVAQRMVAARTTGAIVLNASTAALQYTDQLVAYAATKAAVRMLAIAMASELGVHRIRVNCVMPGVIETGMTAAMLAVPGHRQRLLSQTPVGRLGTPEDIAELVAFLLSDRAGFITGVSVPIDGGEMIHGHPQWFWQDYRDEHDDRWRVGL